MNYFQSFNALVHNSIVFSAGLVNSMIVIHWPSYSQSLVRRGEILFHMIF